MNAPVMLPSESERREIEAFIYNEALYADESRYAEWESLLDDDMHYWVPISHAAQAGEFDASIINDNRSRLATRVRQLRTGTRHSQVPVSRMRRLLTNMVMEKLTDESYKVEANFVIHEYQRQSVQQLNVWAGRVEYRLRKKEDALRMYYKKVLLVNSESPIPSLSFIV